MLERRERGEGIEREEEGSRMIISIGGDIYVAVVFVQVVLFFVSRLRGRHAYPIQISFSWVQTKSNPLSSLLFVHSNQSEFCVLV